MTVAELIKALKKMDPKLNVWAGTDPGDYVARSVDDVRRETSIACNDAVCPFVFLQLGDKV